MSGSVQRRRLSSGAMPLPRTRARRTSAQLAKAASRTVGAKAGNAWFCNLAETAPVAIIVHRDFRPLFANARFADLFGLDGPEAVLALDNWLSLFAPECRDLAQNWIENWKAGQEVPERRLWVCLDGRGRFLATEHHMARVDWEGGEALQSAVVSVPDEAAEGFRLRHDLDAVLGSINDAVALYDAQGRLTRWNATFGRVFHRISKTLHVGTDYETILRACFKEGVFGDAEGGLDAWLAGRREERRAASGPSIRAFSDGTWWQEIEVSTAEGGVIQVLSDITPAVERGHALRDSEERFRAFADASASAILFKDTDLIYRFINRGFERLHGISAEMAIGRRAEDFMPPEISQRAVFHDREVLESGEERTYEFTTRLSDGTLRGDLVSKFPVRNRSGKIIGIGAITTDISKRRRGEESLRRVNRALQTLSSCNEALVRATEESDLLASICRILVERGGYALAWIGEAEQTLGKRIRSIAAFGEPASYLETLRTTQDETFTGCGVAETCLRTGRPAVINDAVNGDSGDPCFKSWRETAEAWGLRSLIALPLARDRQRFGVLLVYSEYADAFDPDEVNLLSELADDVAYGILALRGNEERRQAETMLRKLSRVVEQAPVAVFITDAEGVIEYVNPKFAEVTGYTPDDALGKTPRILRSGDVAPEDYARMWRLIKNGREWHGTLRNRRKDGSLFWVESSISPVRDESGRLTHFVSIQQDITERLETERRLRHGEKMEALGQLAGGIAHDFNNMLLPIRSLTGMTLKELPEGAPGREWLGKVLEASGRASELVAQILAFTRGEQGRVQVVDLAAVVNETMPLLRATLPSTIRLEDAVDPASGVMTADRAQLQTVLLNLAANAADAMAGRPGVLGLRLDPVLRAEETEVATGTLPAGRYARLVLEDTGVGMDQKVLERMFEPFFTTKAVGHGTGLGLAMVHGIVKRYGGGIHVESVPGKGTAFEILFPASEEPPSDAFPGGKGLEVA